MDPTPDTPSRDDSSPDPSPRDEGRPLPLNVLECEEAARRVLPREVYDYYAGGGEDEVTVRANRWAFSRWFLRPRRLVDVTEVDTSVELLGHTLDLPVLIAPMAFQRLAHPDGELATVRAAGAAGTCMVVSTVATHRIEDVAAEATGPTWLQLYVFRERELTEELIRRAEEGGVSALCLTVDVPVEGNRERDERNRFRLPPGVEMANFAGLIQSRFPETSAGGAAEAAAPGLEGAGGQKDGGSKPAAPGSHAPGSGLAAFIGEQFDPSLDWGVVEWLRSVTDLPLVLKGVLTAEDARLAVEHGADCVIVSNHGGRQLDGAVPTLLALPEVVEAVDGRIPVLLDGGVRRGTEVAKALALGARAVLVGRPVLWGLALGGQEGVEHVLGIFRSELRRTMRLLGRTRLEELDRSALVAALEGAPAADGGSGAADPGARRRSGSPRPDEFRPDASGSPDEGAS